MRSTAISKYYKSFSGTDTIAFLLFPGIKPITIGSLTTISYSMFRNKVPVINLGRTNINGITRGSRIYAGTMVFTLLNKHWLRELQDQCEYLKKYPTLKVDELPLFDIMIVSANEYGSSAHMFIYGIDFTDEAQTVSVEDLFTENVFKFVAREISVFDRFIVTESENKEESYYTVKNTLLNNYYIDNSPIQTKQLEKNREIKALTRTLYLTTSAPMIGNDVGMIQLLLNKVLDANLEITQTFDRLTDNAVRQFQSLKGLIVNGVVDNDVYTKLLEYTQEDNGSKFMQIINKSGAFVYKEPDSDSNITQVLPYLAQVEVTKQVQGKKRIYEDDSSTTIETSEKYYETRNGYISEYDIYNYDNKADDYGFETLKYNSQGQQVTIYQQILEKLYEDFTDYETGVFDEKTENYTKKFQRDNNLLETGIIDYYNWNILMNEAGNDNKEYFMNHTEIIPAIDPGRYETNIDQIENYNAILRNKGNQQVKISTVSKYKNKNTKTDSEVLLFEGQRTVALSDYEHMFTDDPENGTPTDVLYTIYPYGNTPYKWHFTVKE